MKKDIHPQWYPEAVVTCACGNSWTTGATVPEIHTDICSQCHPFYTGEQRIVDTEGQVDRFLKRLKVRDDLRAAEEARTAARTPANLPLSELGVGQRYLNILAENGIEVVSDLLERLASSGDEGLLQYPGIGRKVLTDLKKSLRSRGYELPQVVEQTAE